MDSSFLCVCDIGWRVVNGCELVKGELQEQGLFFLKKTTEKEGVINYYLFIFELF